MTPNKKIPSFCFESPYLRPLELNLNSVIVGSDRRTLHAVWTAELAQGLSAFHNIDAEAELTALLSEQVAAEINRDIFNTIAQDLVTVQPMNAPIGELFYLNVYDDDIYSWSMGDTFESSIGIKSKIKPHIFT